MQSRAQRAFQEGPGQRSAGEGRCQTSWTLGWSITSWTQTFQAGRWSSPPQHGRDWAASCHHCTWKAITFKYLTLCYTLDPTTSLLNVLFSFCYCEFRTAAVQKSPRSWLSCNSPLQAVAKFLNLPWFRKQSRPSVHCVASSELPRQAEWWGTMMRLTEQAEKCQRGCNSTH